MIFVISHFFPFFNDNWMGFFFSCWGCYGLSVRLTSHRSMSWVWPPPDWGWGYPTNRNQTTPSSTSWNRARYNINFNSCSMFHVPAISLREIQNWVLNSTVLSFPVIKDHVWPVMGFCKSVFHSTYKRKVSIESIL